MPFVWVCKHCRGPGIPGRADYKPWTKCPNCGNFYDADRVSVHEGEVAGAQRQPVIEGEVNSMMDIIADAADNPQASTIDTRMSGVNWVLGEGIPIEAAILLAAFPGGGKTTLLVELFRKLALGTDKHESIDVLLIQTEESAKQIGRRYARLGAFPPRFGLVHEAKFSDILELLEKRKPQVAAIDSLSKLEGVTDSNGFVFSIGSQASVSLAAMQLKKFAAENEMTIFCTGHSTKEGAIAGSNTLIHDLDMTLYIDGRTELMRGRPVLVGEDRVLECQGKNRFGADGRRALLSMRSDGLHDRGPLSAEAYAELKATWNESSRKAAQEAKKSVRA